MFFAASKTRQHARAWALLWLSTTLLTIHSSLGLPNNLWRQVSAPFGVGVRLAIAHRKNKSPLLRPPAVHASTYAVPPRQEYFGKDWTAPEIQTSSYSGRRRSAGRFEKDHAQTELCSFVTNGQRETQLSEVQKPSANQDDAAKKASESRGGSASMSYRPLVFWENMVAGAVSRSIAQTVMHPANTMKTILQSNPESTISNLAKPENFRMLTRGAGANFILSVPHGAVNFAVLELVRGRMEKFVQRNPNLARRADKIGPGLDFISSAISTICCSIVSTPQMMITDNIMAGNYPNLPKAITGLAKERGIMGYYSGWWPGLAGKIPSYAMTWTFFQELKNGHRRVFKRPPRDLENSIMGCLASATTVCIMIPMDTIKTRLVTQATTPGSIPYKGITDCALRVFREEGISALYRGLPPRLVSVVPMIGIQFGVYEFMKKTMVDRDAASPGKKQKKEISPVHYGRTQALEEAAMEVAADDDQPFPAPHFRKKDYYKILPKIKNGGFNRKEKSQQ